MKKTAAVIFAFVFSLTAVWPTAAAAGRKKILYIDSYNEAYSWSADITAGIRSILRGRKDVELKIFHMDTKRHPSTKFKQQAALTARHLIDSWRPDVVIASDDNAAKYLIVPYFRGGRLPFVFCGLNWDASVYGFPAKNVTGMIEVALYKPLIAALKKFARGGRIGYLAADNLTGHKEYDNIVKIFHTKLTARFVRTFTELKQAFLELQKKSDMLILQECRSVRGFDRPEMINFVNQNTTIPTGAMLKFTSRYALLTFAKSGREQGEYAAKTALAILMGKSPRDIPIVANKRAKIYLNLKIAKKLGIKFPMELLKTAHLISAVPKKIFFVNSYHKGYLWSDNIEAGLLKALNITARPDDTLDTSKSDVVLKIYRMDTKHHSSEKGKKRAALAAKKIIESWHPDIILTSDDNAAKYLIAPYYKNSSIPVIFCGVNWDAGVYGFPVKNITGMVEVAPILETIKMLKPYAKGNRLGFIGAKVLSEEKTLDYMKNILHLNFTDGALVTNFTAWKKEYLKLQNTADILVWLTSVGVKGWNQKLAEQFALKHSRIPSGSTGKQNLHFVLLGKVNIGAEQGWWLGNTALRVLDGTSPAEIPLTTNKSSQLYLNMQLAKRLKIKFPMRLLNKATLIETPAAPIE